jgi:hypothetical protein
MSGAVERAPERSIRSLIISIVLFASAAFANGLSRSDPQPRRRCRPGFVGSIKREIARQNIAMRTVATAMEARYSHQGASDLAAIFARAVKALRAHKEGPKTL